MRPEAAIEGCGRGLLTGRKEGRRPYSRHGGHWLGSVRYEIGAGYWLEASSEDPVRGLRPILLAVGSEHHEAPPVW